ncbi:MAG: hypothetical protein U0167_01140 [bacterium]
MWRRWWAGRGKRRSDDAAPDAKGPREDAPPSRTPEDDALLDRIAVAVVRWGMTVPAIFLLESSKPLSFVGSQFLHFLSPLAHSLLDATELDRLAALLERRETVEELIVRIEGAESARGAEQRAEKARRDATRGANDRARRDAARETNESARSDAAREGKGRPNDA